MATEHIRLQDGLVVEVEVAASPRAQAISSDAPPREVAAALDSIQGLLKNAVAPVSAVWSELNRDLSIKEAEVSLNLGFSVSGNLFIARGSGSTSIGIKLTLQPADQQARKESDSD